MFKIALIFAMLFLTACSNSSTPSDTTSSTVAVTKQPISHTASDLKQAFNTQAPSINKQQRGAKLARKCLGCHTTSSHNKMGPGLKGIYNRAAGSMPDMRYSPALKNGNWQWDTPHLAAWLCDSQKALQTFSRNPNARSKMPAQHICDPTQQADLIAHLKTL